MIGRAPAASARSGATFTVRDVLRALPQFHEHHAVVAWWQARTGTLFAHFTPERRRMLLSVGGLGVLAGMVARALRKADGAGASVWPAVTVFVVVLAALYGCYLAAERFKSLPSVVQRRPQVALHLGFWGMLAVVWMLPRDGGAWAAAPVAMAMLLPFYLWRCGYLLKSGQRGHAAGTRFVDHLFYLSPVYGGTDTPFGKGFDHLVRHEAHSGEALARAQLAGVKLLLLALVWRIAEQVLAGVVYGDPKSPVTRLVGGYGAHLPRLEHLLAEQPHVPVLVAWGSLYLELVREVLDHAARGHVIVGMLRLLGFNVFRNTYKPLLAESLVDFWNRYYYYFKELLVDFFFYPTFARRFRRWPRMRIVTATFAAAFLGNMYYHSLAQDQLLLRGALWPALAVLRSRTFYCFLLAVGISVSMLREQRRRGTASAPGGLRRAGRIACVWTFFAIIHIWGVGGTASFARRTRFFASLFGLA